MSAEHPRAVLVDDHPTLRASLKRVLEADGFVVCGEAAGSEEGLHVVRETEPDVCLVGAGMGGTLEMIDAISGHDGEPGTVVIVLTASRATESMVDAIRAGASGYLLKEMNSERIPAAVRGALSGEAAMPRTLVARLIREIQRLGRGPMLPGPGGLVELTPRQWEVLGLMADRLETAEIAERLMVSPVTVRRHAGTIQRRLGVADREAAVELLRSAR
ncbi:MAG TPA: response regulator transcription factor [Solirubrobacterales bacterium]|nr:response regulator transcription factor [Solirubrobacterales bacterium]